MTEQAVTSTASPEAALWIRAASGDPTARDELARLALEVARPVLRYYGAPFGDIDDLAQATALSTLQYLERRPEPPADIRVFLKWRARGVLSGARKASRRRPLEYQSELSQPLTASFEDGPLGQLVGKDAQGHARDCLDRLRASPGGDKYAELIAMRYERHLDNQAIASERGLNPSTVGVRLKRGLDRLRECMRGKGHDL